MFAAALVGADRYRPGEVAARAWLFGIAKNKLAGNRKRWARDLSARRKLGLSRLEFTDEAIEEVERLLDSPEERYLDGMAKLTQIERDAVRARILEERDYADIAARSGSSQAAIRQRVSRGLAKLARLGRQTG